MEAKDVKVGDRLAMADLRSGKVWPVRVDEPADAGGRFVVSERGGPRRWKVDAGFLSEHRTERTGT